MKYEDALKLIALVKGAAEALPGLIASLKGTFSETDEAKLKEELLALQRSNDAAYGAAQAALAERIAKG